MTWNKLNNDGDLRSDDGRFDLYLCHDTNRYMAVDADTGRIAYHDSQYAAQAWCRAQTQGRGK